MKRISLTLALILWATFSFSQKQLVNKTYPRLEFLTLFQSPLNSATAQNFDNKVVVLEFWATWCGPCIAAMPHIAEIQKKYEDKNVQVISISDEDLDTVEDFLEREVRGQKEDDDNYADEKYLRVG